MDAHRPRQRRSPHWPVFVSFSIVFLVAACGDDDRDPRTGRDSGPDVAATMCTADGDCDDGHECTLDSCGVGGVCRYEGIDERCDGEQTCVPGRGCVDGDSCTADGDCNDDLSCTLDRCGVGGVCTFTPVNERCEGPGATCDPMGEGPTGCTAPTGCTEDSECDDGHECTLDACGVDNTCSHTTINERCPEGQICTASGCFASMDCETDDQCDDGDFCNGAEVCDGEFGCQPAPEPRMCMDTDDCTIDSCDSSANACRFACDSSRPECDCPVVAPPCDGIFDITPVPMQTCASLIPPAQVEYAVSEVEFACVGSVLSVDGRNVPNPRGNTPMTQSPRSSDDTFLVETVVAGGCEETYRLEGRFIDDTRFEATFSASYRNTSMLIDECALSGCVAQSIDVTGTRR